VANKRRRTRTRSKPLGPDQEITDEGLVADSDTLLGELPPLETFLSPADGLRGQSDRLQVVRMVREITTSKAKRTGVPKAGEATICKICRKPVFTGDALWHLACIMLYWFEDGSTVVPLSQDFVRDRSDSDRAPRVWKAVGDGTFKDEKGRIISRRPGITRNIDLPGYLLSYNIIKIQKKDRVKNVDKTDTK
jgi:hypothetical protein